MLDSYIEKASILLEALPYIQQFYGKTVVIKYGGSAMEDDNLKKSVTRDIVLLKYVGINPVIIHGGGKAINYWLEKTDIHSEFINGQRKTSKKAMEVIEMVLSGKVNKSLVNYINLAGGKAVGISGKDTHLITAEKKEQLGYVGKISKINPDIINLLDSADNIPVISSVGVSHEGESLNINADFAASEIAIALKAEKLILLSDVDGVLDKNNKIIKKLNASEIDMHIKDNTIHGGMIPKMESLKKAIKNKVHSIHIINGTTPHSLILELFTNYGIGTMIKEQ